MLIKNEKSVIYDGPNTIEALDVLSEEIKNPKALDKIRQLAGSILEYAVDPIAGQSEPSYGLLYGLIQSGKTSIITVTAAMAADNGFKCILILTSDINPLYEQTLQRIRSQLRGLRVLGKTDWNDAKQFERLIRMSPFVIVSSKNKSHLTSLLEAFKKIGRVGARGLSTLVIDDEADQASLNTYTSKGNNDISAVNGLITDFRNFFETATYLQVTATPQALFLQRPDGLYRPSFTVLSEPGDGYVGGEAFFDEDAQLLCEVDIDEVDELCAGHQPEPSFIIPQGLKTALLSFLVGATSKNIKDKAQNFAFLCHISHTKVNHKHLVSILDSFREKIIQAFKSRDSAEFLKFEQELMDAYCDIKKTETRLENFEDILSRIEFLLPGANIKEINSNSDAKITLEHVYSIFVGGNKLGRGVTIPNLIVSYYGRNPKKPNADTVLQHARMYGYRQKNINVTRLFLPQKLAEHFRIIHQMEKALRDVVHNHPQGKFEGIYLESPLKATRSNVLDPNSIGIYTAGGSYNPRYPARTDENNVNTQWLDEQLKGYADDQDYYETDIDSLINLIARCNHDLNEGAELWNIKIITIALEKIKTLLGGRAYIRVRRGRASSARRETQGFLTGGEAPAVPNDAATLFIYRLDDSDGRPAAWWPQLRFPQGNYVLAFSFLEA